MGDGGRGKCLVCHDDRQATIDRDLVAGVPYRQLTDRYGISRSALQRHKADHLSPALTKIRMVREAKGARTLVDRLEQLISLAENFLVAAHNAGNISQGLAAMREMRSTLELLARISGELDMRPTTVVNVQSSPEWIQIRTILLDVMAPYPELRKEVSRRLEVLEGGAS